MINIIDELGKTLWLALEKLGQAFINFVPNLIGAIIIILVGWIIGKVIKKVIITLLQRTKIDEWVEEQNLTGSIGGQKISNIVGSFIKWYVIAIFLIQAVTIFEMKVLGDFLTALAYYIPQVIFALLVVVAGLLFARYVRNVIESTTHAYKKTTGIAVEILLVYFAVVIALDSIYGIEVTILLDAFRIAFTAFALTVAIVVGISFGFAFKDDAKDLLKDLKKSVK